MARFKDRAGMFNNNQAGKKKNDQKISKQEFDNICPIGTHPGILYGLPKVHKTVIDNYSKYFDNETNKIFTKKYKKDIEYFGYKF